MPRRWRHLEDRLAASARHRLHGPPRHADRPLPCVSAEAVIDSLRQDVPAVLVEVRKLGRTLARRTEDLPAYFDRPRTSNGPTEAINGRLEHLRGSALGTRNLTNYIGRCLPKSRRTQTTTAPSIGMRPFWSDELSS